MKNNITKAFMIVTGHIETLFQAIYQLGIQITELFLKKLMHLAQGIKLK